MDLQAASSCGVRLLDFWPAELKIQYREIFNLLFFLGKFRAYGRRMLWRRQTGAREEKDSEETQAAGV
jgi:hypothetical protein